MKGNPKDAIGRTKPSCHFTPPVANYYEAKVLEDSAKIYGEFNWRKSNVSATVYCDAIKRHLDSYLDGEDIDKQSGYHHFAHIRANTAILLDAKELGRLIDDRPSKGKCAEVIRKLTKGKK